MSTRGQHQTIRKLCDELNVVELPERGVAIGGLGYGWDGHVHDTATSGRKNPTQLVIDAFIKGISALRVAYGSVSDIEMMEEVLEAGEIMGLGVELGLEYSVMVEGQRYHFMAELPHMGSVEELREYIGGQGERLGEFFAGLDRNREKRLEAVRRLLGEFNESRLVELNEGYEGEYRLMPLSLDELMATIPNMNITPLHVAEFMYMKYRPVLQRRVWYAKVLREKGRQEGGGKREGEEYKRLKEELNGLSADSVLSAYFDAPHMIEYETVFSDLGGLSEKLRGAACGIKFIHPLEHGLEGARGVVEKYSESLDSVEVYNTQDCAGRKGEEVEAFARYVNERNKSALRGGGRFLRPVCGSDATGRNPKIPGMGFIYEDGVRGKLRQKYIRRHVKLPELVSAMVRAGDVAVEEGELKGKDVPKIISMGKVSSGEGYTSTSDDEKIGPLRAWRYFNPTFKNVMRTLIGLFVAMAFVGPGYAFLWIGITGFRNSIVDLISYRGTKLHQWKLKSINFDNVAQSLFWTGFSVPILGFVKSNFDILWPLAHDTFLYNLVKFFFISFANGFYLAAHNTLRGFDRNVAKGNIFRSILAWPLATIFAPVGYALNVPSIVQTKIWSDVVAAFIEGSNKYLKTLRQRQKTLEEIIPKIIHEEGSARYTAMLDILYLFSQEPRTQTTIKTVLSPYVLFTRRLRNNSTLRLNLLVELQKTMTEGSVWTDLVDYIIANYDEEMADDLIELVADGLPLLQQRLGELLDKYSVETKHLLKIGNKTQKDDNSAIE